MLKASDNDFNAVIGRQEVPVKRGQFVFGTNVATEELKMSKSTIWFWLRWLEKEQSVVIKTTNKFSIVSICKDQQYRDLLSSLLGNKKETDGKQKRNRKEHTIKKYKEYKEDKEKISNAEALQESPISISGVALNEIIKLFEPINPSYERLFPNKTQKAALERLIKKYGEAKVRNMVIGLPEVLSRKYAPRITTPVQLENKLGELVQFINQEKNKKGKVGMV